MPTLRSTTAKLDLLNLIQNTTEANKIRYSTDSGHISTIQYSEPTERVREPVGSVSFSW